MTAARRAIPALVWAGVIWQLSALPPSALPQLFPQADKLAHAVLYAVLGGLLTLALPAGTLAGATGAIAIGTLYGVTDEIHQFFVPGRSTEIADVLADWCGVMLAVGWQHRRAGGQP
ncbi:MAG TPA: VanZ family protein [bacterium]|nr:VanZ family protein [bacterium]